MLLSPDNHRHTGACYHRDNGECAETKRKRDVAVGMITVINWYKKLLWINVDFNSTSNTCELIWTPQGPSA